MLQNNHRIGFVVAHDVDVCGVDNVRAMTAQHRGVGQCTFDTLGATAQHITLQRSVVVVVDLHVVILRLDVVERVDVYGQFDHAVLVCEIDQIRGRSVVAEQMFAVAYNLILFALRTVCGIERYDGVGDGEDRYDATEYTQCELWRADCLGQNYARKADVYFLCFPEQRWGCR